ncbi:MAG TPA: glucokinase, partial [Phycisphaerales bacterium]|nr:glucokinase [Phycisphaerales bacterium]
TAARATEAIAAGGKSSLQKIIETNGQISCKDVYEHSAAGDELARQITDETAKSLATLCINLLHITGPRRIIFYGGMIEAGELLLEPIRKFFNEHIWKIRKESIELCFAALGAEAGIIGAAALASYEFKKGKII